MKQISRVVVYYEQKLDFSYYVISDNLRNSLGIAMRKRVILAGKFKIAAKTYASGVTDLVMT